MQLWVGLGNPGPQYAMHRHNVGFMALDVLADMHGFGPVQKKFQGWLQEGRVGRHKVLLLKPATFMNESGRAIADVKRTFNRSVAGSSGSTAAAGRRRPARRGWRGWRPAHLWRSAGR